MTDNAWLRVVAWTYLYEGEGQLHFDVQHDHRGVRPQRADEPRQRLHEGVAAGACDGVPQGPAPQAVLHRGAEKGADLQWAPANGRQQVDLLGGQVPLPAEEVDGRDAAGLVEEDVVRHDEEADEARRQRLRLGAARGVLGGRGVSQFRADACGHRHHQFQPGPDEGLRRGKRVKIGGAKRV